MFRRTFSLTVLAVFAAASLSGQTSGEPKYPRFDFTPQAGYRTDISFPIEPHVQGTNPQLVLDASPSYGFAFGYRIHEDDVVEFRWATQHSTGHFENADLPPFGGHLSLNQFHGDFSHEYLIEGWAKWARPFVMLSAGATHFSASSTTSLTRFSFGIGGGMRFYLGNHLGFKVQAEWLPVVMDPTGTVVCGSGCTIRVGGTTSSQAEATAGPLLRF
jgi:hypothetical protein